MLDGFHVEAISPQPFVGCVFAQSLITYYSQKDAEQLDLRMSGYFFTCQIKDLLSRLMKLTACEAKLESVDETASYLSWKSIVKQVSLTDSG